MSLPNILLVWDRMGDYHRARWRQLQKDYTVGKVFAADLGTGDQLYGWENTANESCYRLLSVKPVDSRDLFARMRNYIRLLKHDKIGMVCIAGYGRMEYLLMLMISKLMQRKVLMFAESWYPGNPFSDKAKGFFLRLWVDHYLVSGEKAQLHFNRRLGIPLYRITPGYSVVDNAHFASGSGYDAENPSIGNPLVLLSVARFSPEKNLETLIRAFYNSKLATLSWKLVVVGGGPQKETLQQLIKDNKVELRDWLPYTELPNLYKRADCFVLVSTFEPWGLVINEAMAASLPLILSDACGGYPNLLNSSNGWLCQTSVESVTEALNKLASISKTKLREMGRESASIIKNYSTATWAQAIITQIK